MQVVDIQLCILGKFEDKGANETMLNHSSRGEMTAKYCGPAHTRSIITAQYQQRIEDMVVAGMATPPVLFMSTG